MSNKSIILLSGGLDSTVLLGVYNDKYGIDLALTFNYGQKTADKEINASAKICEYYGIKHKIIDLDWLKDITHSNLVSGTDSNNKTEDIQSLWVPNRNGLFLNIAGCFADSYGYNYILFGANKDEGVDFPDNTENFRERITQTFEYSTLKKPIVAAPLINYTKDDIVKIALENNVPLEFIRSCYYSVSDKQCGKCVSCTHLKKALENNKAYKYIEVLFG